MISVLKLFPLQFEHIMLLNKQITVIVHSYGSLIEGLKLIYYRLVVVNVKVVILKQPLKHIPSHSLRVKTITYSLPPCKCKANKPMSSKRDLKLYRVKSVLDHFDPMIGSKGTLEAIKLWGASLNKGRQLWLVVSKWILAISLQCLEHLEKHAHRVSWRRWWWCSGWLRWKRLSL